MEFGDQPLASFSVVIYGCSNQMIEETSTLGNLPSPTRTRRIATTQVIHRSAGPAGRRRQEQKLN